MDNFQLITLSFCLSLIATIRISNGQFTDEAENGIATVFKTVDSNENNNCIWQNIDPITDTSIFPFGNFAAVNSHFFQDGLACGECYELSCVSKMDTWGSCDCINDKTVTVMVMDYGHDIFDITQPIFDLPQSVANNILSGSNCQDGSRYNIQYKQVCCDHQQNIAVFNFEGITEHWLSFVVANVRRFGEITDLWMREPGRSDYYACNRNTNNMNGNWVCDPWTNNYDLYYQTYLNDNGQPFTKGNEPPYQLPIDIKIRDSSGAELESLQLITSFNGNQQFDFGTNFEPLCNTLPTTSSTQNESDSDSSSSSSDSDEKINGLSVISSKAKTYKQKEANNDIHNDGINGILIVIIVSIICSLVLIGLLIIYLKCYHNKTKKGEMILCESDVELVEGRYTQGNIKEKDTLKSSEYKIYGNDIICLTK